MKLALNKRNNMIKINLYITMFLFLSKFGSFHCQNINDHCLSVPKLSDTQCFNNIINYNNNVKAGNIATNNNGDLIIELYNNNKNSSTRIFYGLTKEGRQYFSDRSSYTYELNLNKDAINDFSNINIDLVNKSINLFISLKNDNNKRNQYLFSLNSYVVELHNFNDNNHLIWSFKDFFKLNNYSDIFPYEYFLFELPKKSTYIIAFIQKEKIVNNNTRFDFLKKFRFTSFGLDTFEEIKSLSYNDYYEKKIISVFLIDDSENIAIVYSGLSNELVLKLYNYELEYKNFYKQIQLYYINQLNYDLFIKTFYLQYNYTLFVYFSENDFCFVIYSFNGEKGLNECYKSNYKLYKKEEPPSDFIKINNNKFIFLYTNYTEIEPITIRQLSMFEININQVVSSFSLSAKKSELLDFGNYIPTKQISGFLYNDFLLLSTTYKPEEDRVNTYYSLLMIFGYANGTDSTIDISKILINNNNENDSFSLFKFLYQNLTIENNIFGYVPEEKIKLIFIPKELIISKQQQNIFISLENNSYIYQNDKIILNQSFSSIKTSRYYYIDYQYIVKEKEISNGMVHEVEKEDEEIKVNRWLSSSQNENEQKTYYGRINRLQFKLCHEYCQTCREIGISYNDQKCLSCLPNYQYDYWYYYNNTFKKCVPEGYYNDLETNTLYSCDEKEYKYYKNKTDNRDICFKDIHECPTEYPLFNEKTKECFLCDYYHLTNGECSFDNFNSTDDTYDAIKDRILSNYDNSKDDSIIIYTENNYAFQITTVSNELGNIFKNKKSNFTVIDLKECADVLKKENGLSPDSDLILLKYENQANTIQNGNEKSMQYEVYAPNSNKKLNLSICSDINIDVYVPIQLKQETHELYEDLKTQGYNMFDKEDKFYTDICTPYKSKNGTDVLLSDRYNDYFTENQLTCQANCEYSAYLPDSQYLKCECSVVNEEQIETNEPEKITAKSIVKTFYDTLKYSNYKVLKCYKLVIKTIFSSNNFGNILTFIYFMGYLISFAIFSYRNIFYLKEEIGKLFAEEKIEKIDDNKDKDIKKDGLVIFDKTNDVNKQNLKDNISPGKDKKQEYPKRDTKRRKSDIQTNRNKVMGKNKTGIKKLLSINRSNINQGKKIILDQENIISRDNLKNKLSNVSPNSIEVMNINSSEKNGQIIQNKEKIETKNDKNEKEVLDDYELNDLEYAQALELDDRNFFGIYFYLLKREHIILFTFFSWNDFNIFSIKLSKLFLSICTDMAFNVFFFSDESMHDIYVSGGKHDFFGQLAQMVYSTIVSQIIQTFINFLTMTDIHYYQIKDLIKDKKINQSQALPILKCVKYKIIIFYTFTSLLFLFFWYLISAFCAVYQNTQIIFITDSISSFIMGLLYPFILYLIPAGLRTIALKLKSKNLKILYSLSDKIPLF